MENRFNIKLFANIEPTQFTGYEELSSKAKVLMLFNENYENVASIKGKGYVVFDKTPFYALSGGQASDKGIIYIGDYSSEILDVRKDLVNKYYIHEISITEVLAVGDQVKLVVNEEYRNCASKNHSALHITWKTILNLVGHHVEELGSKLDNNKYQLQFAFEPKITEQLANDAAHYANEHIFNNDIKTSIFNVTYQEAVDSQYIYEFTKVDQNELVRVVQFGDIVSEACAGTHVSSTKELKQTYFLNFDKSSKRILIDYTTNALFAKNYFDEKITNKITYLKEQLKKYNILHYNSKLEKLANEPKSYLVIKELNDLYNNIIKEVNKINSEISKDILNKFLAQELKINKIGTANYALILDMEENFDSKILVAKASNILKNDTSINILCLILESTKNLTCLLMCKNDININLKTLLEKITNQTEFKGGGSTTLVQIRSNNLNDKNKLLDILSNYEY